MYVGHLIGSMNPGNCSRSTSTYNAMRVSTLAIILQEKLNQLEADLGEWRNQMALGYTNPQSGKFEKASSVQLRNTMRTDASEDVRKACWEVSCLIC